MLNGSYLGQRGYVARNPSWTVHKPMMGQHQWTIKLSGNDIDHLSSEAIRIDDLLNERYKSERGA